MIEDEHAREASDLLGSAIAAIIEDIHPITVEVHILGDDRRVALVEEAGRDVVTLAAAIRVLKRISVSTPAGADGAVG